jgi:hypothetical protein
MTTHRTTYQPPKTFRIRKGAFAASILAGVALGGIAVAGLTIATDEPPRTVTETVVETVEVPDESAAACSAAAITWAEHLMGDYDTVLREYANGVPYETERMIATVAASQDAYASFIHFCER